MLLIYQFVSTREKRMREIETQIDGSLELNDQFELGWLFDRQLGWICAFKNLVDVVGGARGHGNAVGLYDADLVATEANKPNIVGRW